LRCQVDNHARPAKASLTFYPTNRAMQQAALSAHGFTVAAARPTHFGSSRADNASAGPSLELRLLLPVLRPQQSHRGQLQQLTRRVQPLQVLDPTAAASSIV